MSLVNLLYFLTNKSALLPYKWIDWSDKNFDLEYTIIDGGALIRLYITAHILVLVSSLSEGLPLPPPLKASIQ